MELKVPAKVNWHLAVGRRRDDGYHPIASIFQTCSLYDVLDVEVSDGPFSIEVLGLQTLCEKGASTLDKAAFLWHSRTGFDKAIKVFVKKGIPSQAGLGGGSSDAAGLLRFLNDYCGSPLDVDELMALGAKVGCDVPFFVLGCRAALVEGLGEIVHPIEARTDLEGYVVMQEGTKVSTREAYQALDTRPEIPELDDLSSLEEMYRRPVSEWTFRNDFDMVNTVPDVEVGQGERLLLTGSGSCHVLLTERKKLTLGPEVRALKVSF